VLLEPPDDEGAEVVTGATVVAGGSVDVLDVEVVVVR
jgi:hypothetical protein